MRQGQQNRRGRGRNNNTNNTNNNSNRKSQNPLTRSFESAGPDVKLRGTPSHIAEKYISLARDALSSGDPVLAENYLQHAEHYNRIILTFREQQLSQGGGDPYQNGMARTHSLTPGDGEGDEFSDEDGASDDNSAQQGGGQGDAPQPNMSGPPQQRYDNRPPRHDNQQRDNRQNNNRNDNRYDRNERFGGEPRQFRDDRGPPRQQGGDGQNYDGNGGYRRRDRFGGADRGQDRNQDRNSDRQHDRGPDRGPNFAAGGSETPPQHGSPNGFERHAPQPPASAPAQTAPPQPAVSPIEQEQPAFLRRPVRRPRRDDGEAPPPRQPVTEDQD